MDFSFDFLTPSLHNIFLWIIRSSSGETHTEATNNAMQSEIQKKCYSTGFYRREITSSGSQGYETKLYLQGQPQVQGKQISN